MFHTAIAVAFDEWHESRGRRAAAEQLMDEARRLRFLSNDADLCQIVRAAEKMLPRPVRRPRMKGTRSWDSQERRAVKLEIMIRHKLHGLSHKLEGTSRLEASVTWQEMRRQNPNGVDLSYFVDLEPESLKKAVFGR